MPEEKFPPEFETQVQKAMAVPEPKSETMDALRVRFITQGKAALPTDVQPDSASKPFRPEKETKMKRNSFSPRLAWALAALVVALLVILFTRPTVVNALKRLFGYVPNVGIVDQSTGMRMLAEPITATRENVTVTIEQAFLNAEKTIIVYSYILPPELVINLENATFDERQPYLQFPDGSQLLRVLGSQKNTLDCPQCSMRYMIQFESIPADVQGAKLVLPSLVAVPLGFAPLDWEFQLKFKEADPAAIAPITEQIVTPAPTQESSSVPTAAAETYGITNSLNKFAVLPDGYMLFGSTEWTDPRIQPYGVSTLLVSIKDATGTEISFEFADSGIYPAENEMRVYWAYKVGTAFTAPLSLSFAVTASIPADGGSFTFDPGGNPQLGQKWDINQDVMVNGTTIHVLTAEQAGIEPDYFLFTMQSDSNIIGAAIADLSQPMMGGGGGGGGGMPQERVPFVSGFGYQVPIPPGPLTMTFINIEVVVPGEQTISWSPP